MRRRRRTDFIADCTSAPTISTLQWLWRGRRWKDDGEENRSNGEGEKVMGREEKQKRGGH